MDSPKSYFPRQSFSHVEAAGQPTVEVHHMRMIPRLMGVDIGTAAVGSRFELRISYATFGKSSMDTSMILI